MLLDRLHLKRIYGSIILGVLSISVLVTAYNVGRVSAQGSWWNPNWSYRKMITVDHTKVSADLNNFPVLIDITDADLTSKAQSDGRDIVFTSYLGIKLNFEIESYDNGTGHLVCWVNTDLSSTADTSLYMYYGNSGASNQENSTGVWDSNYCMVQHLAESEAATLSDWHKYENNPTLNGTRNGFASVFYDNSSGVYHLYCSWGSILHFTSSNGKTGWTADPLNPMLTGNGEGVPMVWKEDSVWYMLYRYGGPDKIGLANSTDASHWTRYEGNPVINVGSFCDPWGVIKVGSTYYLWYNDGWGGGYGGRCAGLATSTDLKTWTQDSNNPIFTGGRFCVFPFKYGSYYYMLVPRYTSGPYGEIELYRDVNPTFYPGSRQYLGVVINPGPAGAWDDHRFDTPAVLTDTIYRDTYEASNNELWTYYAGTGTLTGSGADWWTGMCIEQNITDALTRFGTTAYSHFDSTANHNDGQAYGSLDMNVTGKINGADEFDGFNDYVDCGDSNSLNGMTTLTIEAWVKPKAIQGSGIVAEWSSWTAGTGGSYILWQSSTGHVGWGVITETSTAYLADTPVLQPDDWYHLVGTYNGSQIRLYINGTQAGTPASVTGRIASTSNRCYVGRYTTPYMNGTIDEVRISNVSRSVDWISTEYNNQLSPASFYTVGAEETQVTKIYIDPLLVERTYLDVGSYFNLSIMVQNITDLFGFDFNITWNNALATFHASLYTETFDSIWGAGNWQIVKNENGTGWYKLVAVSTNKGFNATGSQQLFTVEFRVEDPHTNTVQETPIHFQTDKLSDSKWSWINHTTQDGTYRFSPEKPALQMTPSNKTCRKYDEPFTMQVNVSGASDVEDFKFEIHYNTTLLDFANVTWNAWGSGTLIVDAANGNLTGSTSGSPINGAATLITIQFNASYHHIWRNLPGWVNDQSSNIYIQWANLSYPSGPDLGYVRGGLNEIDVGPDFVYTFSPIQGDVDNNGSVDVFDLRTVSFYYDTVNSDYNLIGEDVVDIFDLVIIGSNYGYTYAP